MSPRATMSGMRFTSDIWLPRPRDEVFQFFSEAANLDVLTPPWLHFEVLTPAIVMCPGAHIDYRLRLYGIPLRWQSEITRWAPPDVFVDEQRRGPYRRWVHTHTFADERGGTRVGDAVEFEVPLGGLVGRLVMRDVRRIFTYRQRALQRMFTGQLHSNEYRPLDST
jgi:ligand-binding SRPBCC domain-containing protein